MNEELAKEIVNRWKTNDPITDVPGLCDYLTEHRIYIPFTQHVQRFLATTNKAASDAMWDDKPVSALKALLRYGVNERLRVFKPKPAPNYLNTGRETGKLSQPKHDWKYVKAVRSK
jgi:hypothetical protein